MTDVLGPEHESFAAAFFGDGNEIRLEILRAHEHPIARCGRMWLQNLSVERRPLILPRKWAGAFEWYAIAFDEPQLRELREQVIAFVGPSFSTFRGARATLDPEDPVEAAVLRLAGDHAMRFTGGATRAEREGLVTALELMWETLQGCNVRPPEPMRATGRVLREFHMALAASDRSGAEAALAYLRHHHRLDALNLRFLEIQLRAELGLWEEILCLPILGDLLQARRPPAVTRALIQAIYRVRLALHEAAGDIEQATRVFAEQIMPQSGTLFGARVGMNEPEVLKAFMLLAVTARPPRLDLRDELLAVPGIAATDLAYLQRLAACLPVPAVETRCPDPLAAAQAALEASDPEGAMRWAEVATGSLRRTKILLQCAYELRTLDTQRLVTVSVQELSPDDRERLFRSPLNRDIWRKVTGTEPNVCDFPRVTPGDWREWFEQLNDADRDAGRLLQIATAGADEWDLEPLVHDPPAVQQLVSWIDRCAGAEILRNALPYLIRYLQRDERFPRQEFQALYERLRMALIWGAPAGTAAEFLVFSDLCQATLALGASDAAYKELLQETAEWWSNFAAYSLLGPALDILDQFVYFPCPAPVDRNCLATAVITQGATWARTGRMSPEEWRFLNQLAIELDLSELLAGIHLPEVEAKKGGTSDEDPLSRLRGKVAIHTLTEGAGVRVRQVLQQRSPECRVELNSDKSGTCHLKDLARTADLFVLVTSSAKHAATGFIEMHRPTGRSLLRPVGKGTSSILRALVDHLHESQGSTKASQ